MKEYTWKAKKTDPCKGTIVLKIPNIKERFELAEGLKGDIVPYSIVELVEKHITSVQLEMIDKVKVNDLVSFLDYQFGFETVQKLFEIIVKGIPLENP